MEYKLVIYPDSGLLTPTESVSKIDDDFRFLVNEMISIMNKSKGVGLSANQVGSNQSVFVTAFYPYIFINPTIAYLGKRVFNIEGCLSLPGIINEVPRTSKIRISYFDLEGKEHIEIYRDHEAFILQHEYDHLYGKLILSYV